MNEIAQSDAVTGFVCEWKIDRPSTGYVDVIQIAHMKTVYVLHIDRSWNCLPSTLISFLTDSNIKKAGRQVGGDFSRLNTRFGITCTGALELGALLCSS